jgi:GcrA cell cycle regulator
VTAAGDWVDGEAEDLMTGETTLCNPGPSTSAQAGNCPCPGPHASTSAQQIEPLADGVVSVDPVEIEPLAEAAPVAVDIPRRQGLTLLELTSRSCRWPIGDSRNFCGAATSEQPYCEVHRAIAYRAPAQR